MATDGADVMLDLITGALCPNKDIIAALITSAVSIRNTDRTNQVRAELIRVLRENYTTYVNEYNFEFLTAMSRDNSMINWNHDFLEALHQDFRNNPTNETRLWFQSMVDMILEKTNQIQKNGPEMLKSPWP